MIQENPLKIHSTPEKRGEWVDNLTTFLENKYDKQTIMQIRQGCFCNENGRLENVARELKILYLKCDKNIEKFVSVLNERGAGWYFENGYLYTKYFSCPRLAFW